MDLRARWYLVFCMIVGGYLGHTVFWVKKCPLYFDAVIGAALFGLALTMAIGAIALFIELLSDTYTAARYWWNHRHDA